MAIFLDLNWVAERLSPSEPVDNSAYSKGLDSYTVYLTGLLNNLGQVT